MNNPPKYSEHSEITVPTSSKMAIACNFQAQPRREWTLMICLLFIASLALNYWIIYHHRLAPVTKSVSYSEFESQLQARTKKPSLTVSPTPGPSIKIEYSPTNNASTSFSPMSTTGAATTQLMTTTEPISTTIEPTTIEPTTATTKTMTTTTERNTTEPMTTEPTTTTTETSTKTEPTTTEPTTTTGPLTTTTEPKTTTKRPKTLKWGNLKIIVIRGSLPKTNFWTDTDPFVKVKVGSKYVGKTTVISDNRTPYWNEHFFANKVHIYDVIRFDVYDVDVTKAQWIGSARISVKQLLTGDNSGRQIDLPLDGGYKLQVEITWTATQ